MESIELTPEMLSLVKRVVRGELVLVGNKLVTKHIKVRKNNVIDLVKEFIVKTQNAYPNKTCYFSIKDNHDSFALLDAVSGIVECDRDSMLKVVNSLVECGYLIKVVLKGGKEIEGESYNNFQIRYKLATMDKSSETLKFHMKLLYQLNL